uniref:SCO5389 family protein n=1 Tax=Nocardia cyriacigeorgica TaxID=135487 RepID=UPI002454AC89
GTAEFADNEVPPPDEVARGQLLRALASDAMRGGLVRVFGVMVALQNCVRVAAFPLSAVGGETYTRYISTRAPAASSTAGPVAVPHGPSMCVATLLAIGFG